MQVRAKTVLIIVCLVVCGLTGKCCVKAQQAPDYLRQMQLDAIENNRASWGHWGDNPSKYSSWTYHSNRLTPVYTFGIRLDAFAGENSCYRDESKLKKLYGQVPEKTHNPDAEYFDQTDIYQLQKKAIAEGKKHIILVIFDGMDWQTSQAAAIYKTKKVAYTSGRGTGLSFLDYSNCETDFGFMVTSPHNNGTKVDVDSQIVTNEGGVSRGGYSAEMGGAKPWSPPPSATYLLGKLRGLNHVVTDSAASATSMTSGVKTYNSAINVDPAGKQVAPISHHLQHEKGFAIGLVSSVPVSHATVACGYAHNVSRNDYQDLSRDLLGLPSIAHRDGALPGVDVLIGCGWGENKDDDREKQGRNFEPGNKYIANSDLKRIDVAAGGKYVVAQRTQGRAGKVVLDAATKKAIEGQHRLFGMFGVKAGHLPYPTADGQYDPTRGEKYADKYSPEDVRENPTIADMTRSALAVLANNENGFWLLVEAGDVDWASHNNNIDDSIGSVLAGDEAFAAITDWVENNSSWNETAVIVTADHGHFFVLDDPQALAGRTPESEPADGQR